MALFPTPPFVELTKLDYDFVIVDTQPGIPSSEPLRFYDEALLVTLPDEASCISAIKMLGQYKEEKLKSSIVANRVAGKRYELSIREIENLCENKVVSSLPEDEGVRISIAEHIPVYLKSRKSAFSVAIDQLGSVYTSRSGVIRSPPQVGLKVWLISFLRTLFGMK